MFVKNLNISNFKSFKDLAINLNNFNVLIGANASGKSNFIQVFRFIKDLVKYGLGDAISYQGGIEYLKNIKTPFDEPISIKITFYPFIKEITLRDEIDALLRSGFISQDQTIEKDLEFIKNLVGELDEVVYEIIIYPSNLAEAKQDMLPNNKNDQLVKETIAVKFKSFKVRNKEIAKDSKIILYKIRFVGEVNYEGFDYELPKEIEGKLEFETKDERFIPFNLPRRLFGNVREKYIALLDDYIGIYNINLFIFKDKTSLLTSFNSPMGKLNSYAVYLLQI
jgi:AAA15 family ATPase/GTPase